MISYLLAIALVCLTTVSGFIQQTYTALSFGSTINDYIEFKPDDMSPFESSFAGCAWINRQHDASDPMLLQYYPVSILMGSDGAWSHVLGDGFGDLRDKFPPRATWFHYCVSWAAGGYLRVYINGVELASRSAYGNKLKLGGEITIGVNGGTTKNPSKVFGGQLYKLNLYSEQLSSTQIKDMADAGMCSDVEEKFESRKLKWEDILKEERYGSVTEFTACEHANYIMLLDLQSRLNHLVWAETELSKVKSELLDTKTALSSTEEALAKSEDQLNSTEDELLETMDQLNSTQDELLETKDQLNSTKGDLQNVTSILDGTISELQKELNETGVKLNGTEEELLKTKDELNTTQNDLQNVTSTLDGIITDIQKELTGATAKLNNTEEELTETRDKLNATQNDLQNVTLTLNGTISDLREELSETRAELNISQQDFQNVSSTLNGTISDLQKELTGTRTKLNVTEDQLSESRDKLNITQHNLQNVTEALTETRDQLNVTQHDLQNVTSTLNGTIWDFHKELLETREHLNVTEHNLQNVTSTLNGTIKELYETRANCSRKRLRHELVRKRQELRETFIVLNNTQEVLHEVTTTLNNTLVKLEECRKEGDVSRWDVLYTEPYLNRILTRELYAHLTSSWNLIENFVGVNITAGIVEHFRDNFGEQSDGPCN